MKEQEEKCINGMYYQKAFDSVPHCWIIKFLELIGINNNIIPFIYLIYI